ncbi:MAG TPA: DUF6569 family protein [Pyrinomonadaceae bacterium]|nr:DUF6569 family protein [Pyrinomonadaceae bacterium]
MKILESFIENLYTGDTVEFRQLKVTPVFIREETKLPYLEFEAALKQGLVEVTEVSEHGSVPSLLVKNGADRDVLILDGEQLVGAKQNRIVNTTVVVPARSTVEIPVSCVEQGRWRYTSQGFSSGRSHSSSSLRSLKHASVTNSLRTTGSYDSDQSGLWSEISSKMRRMEAHSATMSMTDVYESSVSGEDETRLETEVACQPHQVGYFAFVRGGFAGGDVFGSSELCRAKLNKMLRGHYLDSLDEWVKFPQLTVEEVIGQVRAAEAEQFASVGKGSEMRFESGELQGAWKLVDEFIPHLMVFPKLN